MLTLLAASASLAVATPADAFPPVVHYDNERTNTQYPLVDQVSCDKARGTAFRIGQTTYMTAAHVVSTNNGACKINGNPVTIIEFDGALDYAIIEAGPPVREHLRLSCEGYNKSEWYWSNGYAFGLAFQTSVALYSSAFDSDTGMRLFIGKHTVIPGMSGGPVMNAKGEVVGIVNMYNPLFGISFSRALKDTSICNGRSQGNARAPSVATRL